MFKFILVLSAGCLLAACSGTTVVLVPDAAGKVGQVEVATDAGTTLLSKANESAQAKKAEQPPSQAIQLTEEKVKDMFAETLAKEPLHPEHFRFYFSSGSATLQTEAAAELAKAKTAIEVRKSCDLSVIGHSDRVGDNKLNEGISLQRADSVIAALTGMGVDKKCIDRRYYGENDPAVPTADNVDEPRNRRVEIEIR
jgi:outer membrane protein OmpA-like peptidoglycan-associated protein